MTLATCSDKHFYPRPPRGGRLLKFDVWIGALGYFYPRPPRGGRPIHTLLIDSSFVFLSTSPARGTTRSVRTFGVSLTYFYPRPPRGGRRHWRHYIPGAGKISIHVPREGDDQGPKKKKRWLKWYFYPRPPRGGRPSRASAGPSPTQFLSTSPARGTTDCGMRYVLMVLVFLSTSPARGTTVVAEGLIYPDQAFLSTSPARGTTR